MRKNLKKFFATLFLFTLMYSMNVFAEDTIDSNQYYDVINLYDYDDCIGYHHCVWEIYPKQTGSLSITGIVYDSNYNVIDKISPLDVGCIKGEENYIEYFIKDTHNIAYVDWSYKFTTNPWLHNSVEDDSIIVERFNKVEDNLYVTVRQTKNKYNCFAQLKMLFFKNGNLVNSESGYYIIYADNLNGINSTDVMDFWVYGVDYDTVKFYYEWY